MGLETLTALLVALMVPMWLAAEQLLQWRVFNFRGAADPRADAGPATAPPAVSSRTAERVDAAEPALGSQAA